MTRSPLSGVGPAAMPINPATRPRNRFCAPFSNCLKAGRRIVHVGLARYLGGRQREEIRAELRERHGIGLSNGTVSNLCDRFLVGLERLHVHRTPALRAAMDGGCF